MTGRPIIFSEPMVRALIREARDPGTGKTQTRRLLKPQPVPFPIDDAGSLCAVGCLHVSGERQPRITTGRVVTCQEVPYAIGDRLYVREAWTHDAADLDELRAKVEDAYPDFSYGPFYRATEPAPCTMRWRPSIHMPRWASRLTLIVTAVRVERLASISWEDAIAEGATMRPRCSGYRDLSDGWSMDWSQVGQPSRFSTGDAGTLAERDIAHGSPIAAFGGFINGLHDPRWNYKGDGIFGINPWCCAISFRPVLANIDAHPNAGGLQDEKNSSGRVPPAFGFRADAPSRCASRPAASIPSRIRTEA